jgi:hypothetical protein
MFPPQNVSSHGEATVLNEFPLLMSPGSETILKQLALYVHCQFQTSSMVSTNPYGILSTNRTLSEGFHIVYFEILDSRSQAVGSWDIGAFYDPKLPKFRKSAFTVSSEIIVTHT